MSTVEKSLRVANEGSCGNDGCCSTTEDGNAVCIVPQKESQTNLESASCGCAGSSSACSCGSAKTIQIGSIDMLKSERTATKRSLGDHLAECKSMWQKIRGGVMFGVACIASPCCTPLIVPLVLALLAGTPVAVWMGHNLGWVYGGLTVLSAVSFVLGWRWMSKNNRRAVASSIQPIITVSASKPK